MQRRPVNLFVVLGIALAIVCAVAVVMPAKTRTAKLVITRGGTYSGEFAGDEGGQTVISIQTAQPVIIENATIRGSGHLIASHYVHADVTIRNTRAIAVQSDTPGKVAGRFVNLEGFDNVSIENCSLEGTAGIYLLDYAGDRSEKNAVHILRNAAHNIDGRIAGGVELVQFVQLDKVRGATVEIAWNEIVNEPGKSAVEDNINIYLSSGSKENPIRIHDNFIRGAYAADPMSAKYSGGGILLGDGVAEDARGDASFVVASDNQVLDTTNYGIAIAAGHDCVFERNRIVSAGVLADGKTRIVAQNVGAYIWDSYHAGEKRFYNNSGRENLIGWINADGRNDSWTPNAAAWENNTPWPSPITIDVYAQELRRWQEKLKAKGITVGPMESSGKP